MTARLPRGVFLAWAAPTLMVALLWLPFGLRLGGLIEEWDVLGLFATHGVFGVITVDTPMAMHRLRPFTVLPHALASLADPDSFRYWNVALAMAVWIKAFAMGAIVTRLTGNRRLGVFAGLLLALWPADTMQLAFRSLHINWALALMLAGSAALLRARDTERRAHRLALGAFAAVLMATAVLMYEVAFALLPLPLLLAFARDGFKVRTRSNAWLFMAPLVVVLGYAAYALWTSSSMQNSYQQSVAGPSALKVLQGNLPRLFDVGMPRAFEGGWVDAARMLRVEFEPRAWRVLGIGAGLMWLLVMLAPRLRSGDRSIAHDARPTAFALRAMACGFVACVAGFAPFLVSGAHLAITQRTYLFAAPGAVLVAAGCLWWLAHRVPRLTAATMLAALYVGLGAQWVQFHQYVSISNAQNRLLRDLVVALGGLPLSKRPILVLDESGRLAHTWFLRDNLNRALEYVYGSALGQIEICLGRARAWQRLDVMQRPGRCEHNAGAWSLTPAAPLAGMPEPSTAALMLRLEEDAIIQVQITEAGIVRILGADATHPRPLPDGSPALRRILRLHPDTMDGGARYRLFAEPRRLDHYRFDFGRWWSIEAPTRGAGWREADWTAQGRGRHDASSWKTGPDASLLFDFLPRPTTYVLSGQFDRIVDEPSRSSAQLSINDQMLAPTWLSDGRFVARVPPALLRPGTNRLDIRSTVNAAYFDLSLSLSWFEVAPWPDFVPLQ